MTATSAPGTIQAAEESETTATVARGISKSFGRNLVLDDVSLTVRRGETIALVGESGSGKSTFGRILVGLEKADRGEIVMDGKRVAPGPRAGVSMIFQDPYDSIDPRFTVAQIVGEPLGRRPPRERVQKAIAEVGLSGLDLGSRAGHLSGGQRQRLCIARALIDEPETVVCDEPTAALDALIKTQVLDLLLELQHERQLGLLIITHDLDIAARFADRIAVLENGRIVEEGESAEVSGSPTHPYTQRLFASALASRPGHRRTPPANEGEDSNDRSD
jgi:ABC-type glutathione transport system ATPase component